MIIHTEHDVSKRYPHHTNAKAFFDFLRGRVEGSSSILQPDFVGEMDRDFWIEDLERQNSDTGTPEFDIPARSTISGAPIIYRYRTEWITDPEAPESGSGTMLFYHG